jgi:hypothetical protein
MSPLRFRTRKRTSQPEPSPAVFAANWANLAKIIAAKKE